MLCNRIPALELRFKTYVVVSVLQIVVGASIYGLLWLFEVDAMWTLPLALKWCARKEWVHLNTTPFYCYVRDASALLGERLLFSGFVQTTSFLLQIFGDLP